MGTGELFDVHNLRKRIKSGKKYPRPQFMKTRGGEMIPVCLRQLKCYDSLWSLIYINTIVIRNDKPAIGKSGCAGDPAHCRLDKHLASRSLV